MTADDNNLLARCADDFPERIVDAAREGRDGDARLVLIGAICALARAAVPLNLDREQLFANTFVTHTPVLILVELFHEITSLEFRYTMPSTAGADKAIGLYRRVQPRDVWPAGF
jgi:hypothetical protein